MKGKMEPATNRIKRLLEVLSAYSFNLYHINGKDVGLSVFLSRQQGDNSDPHHITPISFNMKEILKQNYQSLVEDTFLVQTRSQIKAKGVKVPTVHGVNKPLAQHCIPGRQSVKTRKEETKPIIIDDNDDDMPLGLDNKPEFGTQMWDTTVTQKTVPICVNKTRNWANNSLYTS